MKKIVLVAGVIFSLIIIGILLIRTNSKNTNITKEKTKVGLIMNSVKDDGTWGQSHFEGIKNCEEELNLEVIYAEEVPKNEECVKIMEELIKEGCEIIICNSYDYGQYELEVAEKYPDVYFFHASGVKESKNLATYFGRMYQVRYLTGIVAGLQSESGEIGYIAAFDIPEVNRGINAFTLGVREVNPEAVVHVCWSGTWIDYDITSDATNKLLEKHPAIDVLTVHSDSLAAMDIAEEKGIWSIGYDYDNSDTYTNTYLTAAVWNWEAFYKEHIKRCLQGKFQGKHYWDGIESDIVRISKFTSNVKKGISEKVVVAKNKLENGEFDVFYGPIYDNEGNLRVSEGESMTDEAMLNDFNWFVEGVQIDE